MKYFLIIPAFLLALARPLLAQEVQILSDFEDGTFVNFLDGESGAWDSDPEDDSAGCEAEIVDLAGPEDSTRALKLTYDVDSVSTEPVPVQNGFWTKLRNFDARNYDHLEFYVKGDAQAGFTTKFRVELKKFKDSERVEKLRGGFVVENITQEWQKVSIPLNKMTGILNFTDPAVWKDPSVGRVDLDEFVVVFEGRRVDRKSGALYLDNIRFVRTGEPGPSAVDFPPRKKGDKTPVKLEGLDYAKFLAGRLQGFPKATVVKKKFPAEDREFLREVARDTWRFFDEVVDRENQLPLDTIQLGEKEPLGGEVFVGDYTNVTNIGLYLMTLVAAYDLEFISKEEAVRRALATLQTVDKLEYHQASGFPYNYYDTTTAERTSYFVSFVDSGWLAAGMYVVKNAFPEELGEISGRLLGRWNFSFFYDAVDQQMVHGYYEHLSVYSDYHYGTFYTEPRAVSAIAIGRDEVPVEHWYRIQRTFPEDYTWQEQEPRNRIKKKTMGIEHYGGYYEWSGLRYIPSWGGSLFEALMPALILKEREAAPESLGLNNRMHVQGHIRFALEELKYPVWGMSPSSDPDGGYSEFGAKPLGCKGYKAGVVTPHVSFLALEYAPEQAVANLRKMIELYDIYGEYGFFDAVRPETGRVAYKYLCLDQAMSLIAVCNYLKDGSIRRRFHADPIAAKIDPLLSEEKFFDTEEAAA
ncbi:MAG: DUF3131 domain-containing protein [Candidatus Omnitrophica bacterium]|nr:DUF3131 domain-containing protein [Candidatus Omnitrophota bacterium]